MDKTLIDLISQIPQKTSINKFDPESFQIQPFGKIFKYYQTLSDGLNQPLNAVQRSIAISMQPFGDTPWHIHNYIELTTVINGQIQLDFPKESIKLSKGQIILIGKNTIHTIRKINSKAIVFNIAITVDFLTQERLRILKDVGTVAKLLFSVLQNENIEQSEYNFFDTSDSKKIQSILEEIIFEYYQPTFGSQQIINLDILKLLVELIRLRQSKQPKIIADKTSDIFDMLIYIENNFNNLTLTDMAKTFHFHPNYLSAKLKLATGKSFTQLITLQKLNTAALYLVHSNETIAQISEKIGYSDTSYFYHEFKRFFNVTPTQFRVKNQVKQ
ncbi:AraC family transcriptional regulator [Companilactobacillus sp. HBUAS59544]|uniref:AraC family transcriptional regulator n=1 Tax=Companilactobacillus sp. HBUAS59544 TaxID=3109363 RepID=UPI002FF175A5